MKGAQQTEKEEEAYGNIGQGSFTTNSRERTRATNHVGRGADVGECSTIARGRSWAKGLCQLEINLGARISGRRAGGLSKGAGRHERIPSSRANNMHHTMHTSFACPDACSMTLDAFTSRWATPWRCMWRRAATTSAAYARAVPSGNPLPSRLPTTNAQHAQAQLRKCSQKCEVCAFAGVRVGTREPNSRRAKSMPQLHLQRDLHVRQMCGQVTARQQLEQETNADVILAAAKQGDDGGARGQCHQGVPHPSQPVSTSLQYSGLGDYLQGYSNEQ